MTRQSTEALVLTPFKSILQQKGIACQTGQGRANRIPIEGAVYFQFGDLRVDLNDYIVVVEVESAGGVTNLAKYWEAFAGKRIDKPVRLLHLFLQKSANDYASHLLVWQFLNTHMVGALGEKWEAKLCKVRGTSEQDLADALSVFESWLP